MSRLRELLSKVTPRPWTSREDIDYYQGGTYYGSGPMKYIANPDNPRYQMKVPCGASEAEYFERDVFLLEGSEADAELIVTLVNAAEEIADLMDVAREETKLRGSLYASEDESYAAYCKTKVALEALDKKLQGRELG